MPSSSTTYTVASHLRGKPPAVAATYAALLAAAKSLGPVREEAKKTSIHLCRNNAFAGIATQRAGLVLTLKSATDIPSPRIRRREQASANRWHLELKLQAASDVDAELKRWLRAAYALAG
jgi:hypothetical protein